MRLDFFDETAGENDVTSTREITLDNGNILRAFRSDPYGFISFKLDKGQLPEWMQGHFTSYSEADKAIDKYLAYRKMEVEKVPLSSSKFDKKEKA